jgi:hypothetical protein
MDSGSSLDGLKELLLGIFGLFIVMGFVPIVLGSVVVLLLGYGAVAEYVLVLGFFGWFALRSFVAWWVLRRLDQGR